MELISNILYNATVVFVCIAKWIEHKLVQFLFEIPSIEKRANKAAQSLGIVCLEDGEEVTPDEEKQILSHCKYDSIIRFKVRSRKEYFSRSFVYFDLANAEMYMEGAMECGDDSGHQIKQMAYMFFDSKVKRLYDEHPWNHLLFHLEFNMFNLQTKTRAFQVGKVHYDLGNDLYETMLDNWLQYSCGYWVRAKTLNEAQEHKLELIAKKLDLKPGMEVLDIGCGWGMLCKFLAEKYKVKCVGVTISEQQAQYAQDVCKGLDVEIRLQDYRQLFGMFDRIVSVGMFEHVGFKNYKEFMEVTSRCLKDEGLFLLHTIGLNDKSIPRTCRFYHRYIFPNGMAPYATDIVNSTDGHFIIEDWHNFGRDYAKTLNAWRTNFIENWPKIEDKYGERFYRMWIYYLAASEALFATRLSQLWQVVLSKDGIKWDYRAAR